jgi:hypothetical protein
MRATKNPTHQRELAAQVQVTSSIKMCGATKYLSSSMVSLINLKMRFVDRYFRDVARHCIRVIRNIKENELIEALGVFSGANELKSTRYLKKPELDLYRKASVCTRITRLSVKAHMRSSCRAENIESMGKAFALTKLTLDGPSYVFDLMRDEELQAITSIKTLAVLRVKNYAFEGDHLIQLAKELPLLISIDLSLAPHSPQDTIEILDAARNLQHIDGFSFTWDEDSITECAKFHPHVFELMDQ